MQTFFACLLSFFLLLSYILFLWSAANKNKRLLPFHQELSAIETAKPFGFFRFFGFLFCFCFLSHHVALGLRSTVSSCVAKMPWFVLKASTYSKKQTNKQTKNQILKTQSQDNIRAKKKKKLQVVLPLTSCGLSSQCLWAFIHGFPSFFCLFVF